MLCQEETFRIKKNMKQKSSIGLSHEFYLRCLEAYKETLRPLRIFREVCFFTLLNTVSFFFQGLVGDVDGGWRSAVARKIVNVLGSIYVVAIPHFLLPW